MWTRWLLVFIVSIAGCDSSAVVRDSQTRTEGDTTWIHYPEADEKRVAARLTVHHEIEGHGPDEPYFARIEEVAVGDDGSLVVHDIMRGRVFSFRPNGELAGFVGRQGQGPGENTGVVGLAFTPEGDIVLASYDGRIQFFSPEGRLLREWRPPMRIKHYFPLTTYEKNELAIRVIDPDLTKTGRSLFLLTDYHGRVIDSIVTLPTPWDGEVGIGQSSLVPRRSLRWGKNGPITGVGSRLAFQAQKLDGSVLRVEREATPAAMLPEERKDWEIQNEFLRVRSGQPDRFPPAPEHKPILREIWPTETGQVWLECRTVATGPDPSLPDRIAGLRPTPRWLEPLRIEVFDLDGDYLGVIEGPAGIDVKAVGHGWLVGVTRDEHGVESLVRYRVTGTHF